MRNAVFRAVGNVALAVYSPRNPTDSEIDEAVAILEKMDPNRGRTLVLVVSDGGSPSSLQRQRIVDALGNRPSLSAVVTDSMLARGAVTAMTWFVKNMKAFPKSKIKDALDYLGVPTAQHENILAELKRLEPQVRSQDAKRV